MPPISTHHRRRLWPQSGFSLIELLAVIGIMVMIMALVAPVVNSIQGAGDVTKAVYDIKGVLDQARTYAIANNTYVWVGFFEEDGSKASATPAVSGTGRVVIATVASKDGTRGYDPASPPSQMASIKLTPIDKLRKIDNLHLATLNGFSNQGAIPTTGGMARPGITSNYYDLGNSACVAASTFNWPLGATNQYTLSKIINFDPRGVARIQYGSNEDFIPLYIEIGLQGTRGNVVSPLPSNQNTGNRAAIQIDGMTGATRLYRP